MSFLPNLSVVIGKVEGTPGTEESLVAGDGGAVIADPSYAPEFQRVPRQFIHADHSEFAELIGSQAARIKFKTELKGSGTAGTAPKIDAFLRGCCLADTNVPATSDTYAPISSGYENITVTKWNVDESANGRKHSIEGALGNLILSGERGGFMNAEFDFFGRYKAVTDSNPPSGISYDEAAPPQILGITFTVGGVTLKWQTLRLDLGNRIILKPDVTHATGWGIGLLTGRSMTLSFDPEETLVATHDFFGALKAGTLAALSMTVGGTAGNRFVLSCPKLQYVGITEAPRDGLGAFAIEAKPTRDSAGNDEATLAFT